MIPRHTLVRLARPLNVVILITLGARGLRAECDTKNRSDASLWSKVAALHLDFGKGRGQFEGASAVVGSSAIAVALCRWPDYTLAYRGIAYWPRHYTPYVAREMPDLHPPLFMNGEGIELQRRWRNGEWLHPFATVGTGWISAAYEYWIPDGTWAGDHRVEGKSSTRFVDASAGVELNVSKYIRASFALGVRRTGAIHTPELRESTFNGLFNAFTLGFGKFR